MNKIKLLLACATFATSLMVSAQSCDKPLNAETVRIYFVNRMGNVFLSTSTRDDPVVSCN